MSCYIQALEDTLLGEGGIADFITREIRVFANGAGSGANYSELRGVGEPLSGGGTSSGLLSFLKPIDASAGAIKSGGTTRLAARLIALDLDHPDVEDFIDWKVKEEKKVAALVTGSRVVARHVAASGPAGPGGADAAVAAGVADGVPYGLLLAVKIAGENGQPAVAEFDTNYEGEAYQTVTGQNANNSVRVTDAFMKAVRDDADWPLYHRTELRKARKERRDPRPCKVLKARALWGKVALAAWECADPGVQFHDCVNDWNTCPEDGVIK